MSTEITLQLLDGPHDQETYEVLALAGEEALNELFWFRVAFVANVAAGADGPSEAERFACEILGARAAITVTSRAPEEADEPPGRHGEPPPRHEGPESVVQTRWGMVSAIHNIRTLAPSRLRVDCTIVPRAYELTLQKRSRVFMNKFVHEVVAGVLAEHHLLCRWSLQGTYARRQYCVQYKETDHAFLRRLLAEEGIAFFFEHRPASADPIGGAAPNEPGESDVLETAASVVGGVGTALTGVAGLFGSGSVAAVGGAASLAGDALRGPEKDPDTIQELAGTSGSAGPTGDHGDVFCFIDAWSGYVSYYPGDTQHRLDAPTLALRQELTESLRHDGLDAFEFVRTRRLGSDSVMRRDHDFRRPLLELTKTEQAALVPEGRGAPRSDGSSRGRKVLGWEVYEHHGQYEVPYVAESRTRLQQAQADLVTVAGRSTCPRLLPGHVFALGGERYSLVPDGLYAAIRVRHQWLGEGFSSLRGLGWESLAFRFGRTAGEDGLAAQRDGLVQPPGAERDYGVEVECVDGEILYRPEAPVEKPRATSETAIVVGPPGQEIHTDKRGRVRVQFHWDREGKWDDRSSCFLRVVQPWAGAGYGFQFLPRVGTEVLVTFLGGDPDRPVITGSLYDGTHPTPEPLPERATRSAIRTQSSPGGGGFNEIVFEDEKGSEGITIRAQSKLEEHSLGDHAVTVGEDQRVLVSGSQELSAAASQSFLAGEKQTFQAGGARSVAVGGSASSAVGRHRTDRVEGSAFQRIGGACVAVTEHDGLCTVGGSQLVSVRKNALFHVGGGQSGTSSGGNAVAFVHGDVFVSTEGMVQIQGVTTSGQRPSRIYLGVGDSYIAILKDEIQLGAKKITAVANDELFLAAHGQRLVLNGDGSLVEASPVLIRNSAGSQVHLDGGTATVTGPSNAVVQGSQVQFQSGSGSSGSSSSQSQQQDQQDNVTLQLTHGRMRQLYVPTDEEQELHQSDFNINKLANRALRIRFQGTTITNKSTDDQGIVGFHVPDGVKEVELTVLFDGVEESSDLHKLYPDGPLTFLVKLVTDFPAADQPEGKRLRLRNLGYETGLDAAASGLDELTQEAFERFAQEQRLSATEHAERNTVARLRALYGEQ